MGISYLGTACWWLWLLRQRVYYERDTVKFTITVISTIVLRSVQYLSIEVCCILLYLYSHPTLTFLHRHLKPFGQETTTLNSIYSSRLETWVGNGQPVPTGQIFKLKNRVFLASGLPVLICNLFDRLTGWHFRTWWLLEFEVCSSWTSEYSTRSGLSSCEYLMYWIRFSTVLVS